MIKKYSALYFILLLILAKSFAQTPLDLVQKDFPKLTAKFGSKLKEQHARYIFAIDISSSMQPYEASVKENIKNFISALPEGDFVTIIQKCGTEETDFIFSNQPVTSSSRTTIFNYIDQISFDKIGSDGYRMTEKIIEALNQAGSSQDMKYVFMFTDFEYWTKQNQFNKDAVNWKSLKKKFEQTQKGNFVTVTGLRLALTQGVNPSAVYENELEDIFGKVEILPSPNPLFLSTWFNNTKANILRDRLGYVVKKVSEKEKHACKLIAKTEDGKLKVVIVGNEKLLYQSVTLTKESQKKVDGIYNSRPWISSYSPKPKSIHVQGTLLSPKFNGERYNEVEKLVSPEISEFTIEVYQGPGYLQWYIGWPILFFFAFWLLCIFYTIFLQKVSRQWHVTIAVKDSAGNIIRINKSFNNPVSFTIGKDISSKNHLNVEGANFCFQVESRKNILCLPLNNKRSGYYLIQRMGSQTSKIEYGGKAKNLAMNRMLFLFRTGKYLSTKVIINDNNKSFTIEIK